MKNHLAIFALVAAACTGDAPKDSGDTASCTPEQDDDGDGIYDGPIVIEKATVNCSGGNQVTFFVETKGWTDGGYIFSQGTGNPEPQWSDNHTLVSVDYDACGNWDQLERTISDVSTLNDPLDDWQEDQSTVFGCDTHYGDPDVMTYAFAVVDLDGNVAACVAYGEDVTGLKNGNEDRVNGPGFDLSQCTQGVNTMTN